jgi:tryptophan-rich sensory protein
MIISNRLSGLAIALRCSLLVASVSFSLTDTGPWYLALKPSSWKQPDFAFGIIWSAILICVLSVAGGHGKFRKTDSLLSGIKFRHACD